MYKDKGFSKIAGKNDKYGVFLEDSELTIGRFSDFAYRDIGLDGSVNISHLVNKDSKVNLYTDVIGKYSFQQKRRKSYLDFAYSKSNKLDGKNSILNTLNYYGSIVNKNNMLKFDHLEVFELNYKDNADKNIVPDYSSAEAALHLIIMIH